MPPLNSTVLYFPQGHAEHSGTGIVDFGDTIPPYVVCQVSAVKLTADTDEVYAKISLLPLPTQNYCDSDSNGDDANNGGGFSVPRYCAETILPRLDYAAEPPVQVLSMKDVHGRVWKFRHIYRGTPRRHLLTTGWSNFVNYKQLVAGDSIVFFRADNGDIRVGIRRAKRGVGGGFAGIRPENENAKCKVNAESVIEAANLAATGKPFEIVYYPRASSPEFCVKASTVKAAMKIRWAPGMRFKMAFDTEDSSRISWFMGTISSVRVDDQIRWPNSPWRLLQVTWDEPELLQNVKRVNPWLVELVAGMPPPRKKLRFPHPPDFLLFTMPASIQGARHSSQFGLDHQLWSNPMHLYPHRSDEHYSSGRLLFQERDENISCLLTIGNDSSNLSLKKKKDAKDEEKPMFVLFGQPIVTEPQLSETGSNDTNGSVVLQNGSGQGSSEEDGPCVETGHCKDYSK
ncbi:hypothetical protein L1987_15833 [Smallanthus sonchifolius]|uniref:Uncharacterized protein n=1 Tax=Smallanthus sonchifolius TaxID=185202 RepID=A0ACB9J6P3_9ASTR|nr:hypothetical protein L1987_15833 [Smallanthus sonchifolius]